MSASYTTDINTLGALAQGASMSEQDGNRREPPVRNEMSGMVAGNLVQAGHIGQVNLHPAATAPAGVPRQLPPRTQHFVDRIPQCAELSAALGPGPDEGAPRVILISGPPGVGKNTLATQWAHTVADRFPDGQLYFDLAASRRDGAVDLGDVLFELLRDLGVHEDWIPAPLDRRAALFRSRTAGLRVLVMLTGVQYPAQVRQLIPGSADSVLLATAERRIGVLLAEGAADLELRPLDPESGLLLLRRMLGDARVDAEPEAAGRLVGLCGGLPLAVRIAAALLAPHRNRRIRRLADDLENPATRLAVLTPGSRGDMNALFDSAVQGLPAPAARAYRLLGLHPGPEFSAPAAAALLGVPSEQADRLLDELVESCLLGEDEEGRYRFHDLIRLHARTRAEQDEPPEVRIAAIERILAWYLAQAYRADWIAIGRRLRVGGPPFDTPDLVDRADVVEAGPELRDDVEALDWLDRERGNLLAAQALAVEHGLDTLAWRICEPLWVLFLSRKYYADWVDSQTVARDAAARSGEAAGEAQARKQLAAALRELGRLDEADAELTAALDLAVRANHERLHASVLEAIGKLRLARHELPGAMAAFEQSRAINLRLGNARGVLLQETMIGRVMLRESRHGEAYALLCRVLPGMDAFDERNQARVRISLARAAAALGRLDEAAALFGQAAELYRRRGEPTGLITALEGLADVAASAGLPEQQRSYLELIVELYEAGAAGEGAEPYRRQLARISR